MAITQGYATLDELKHINVLNLSTTASDDILESVIEGISRAIDNRCGRRFFSASETRYYTAESGSFVPVDDIAATGVTLTTDNDGDGVYENAWVEGTDFELTPYNAPLSGLSYTTIEFKPHGAHRFPIRSRGVKVTASFGYPAVPKPINRACVLQATRLFKRYITPLGVSAASAVGEIKLSIPAFDADVEMLLRPYERLI